ncbi:hypothetical protein GP486_005191 [Trichoglossum hirsutum]|uniref:N-acetyltransferase domain-containing protein n=1 Tax=Trichoglossum hirsutum TaxID=265104 RepID=A0A9P8RMQ5_9PEZI|nr:hypothetical protein GP486_005191 [Trichoglossum hirsutum]
MAIRVANPSDLSNVLEVVLSALSYDPCWDYRYQYRHQYPEDNLRYTKHIFQLYIDPRYDDWRVMVAEAPSLENPSVTKIVAVAVWDVTYINKRKHGRDYETKDPVFEVDRAGGATRRDANPERMKVSRDVFARKRKKRFHDAYGDSQIYLHVLATHADYQRRGYGSVLCRWGMATAKDNGLAVCLMASPMGFLLYSHLGFKVLGNEIIQVPGEEEEVRLRSMVLELEENEEDRELL